MNYIKHLNSLKPFCLITTARGGSDFFQSLLDGHPEICLFNLNFRFLSEYLAISITWKNQETNPYDFIDEFIGKNLTRLVSKYNIIEGQDRLGLSKNKSLEINTEKFKNFFLDILQGQIINEKNILLALYGSYHMSLNRDLKKTKIIFHHAHNIHEAIKFKEFFHDTKLIITTRDPRSSFVSSLKFARNDGNIEWDNYRHLYISLCQTVIEDPSANSFFNDHINYEIPFGPIKYKELIKKIDQNPLIIRLEDIPKKSILVSLVKYFKINYSSNLEASTWGDLEWWGDRLSSKKLEPKGWTENRTYNGWSEKLSYFDKILFEICLYDLMLKYKYISKKSNLFLRLLSIAFIFLPMRFELRYLDPFRIIKIIIIGGLRQKLHAISFPYYFFKVRIILIFFIMSQKNKIWSNWPGKLLED